MMGARSGISRYSPVLAIAAAFLLLSVALVPRTWAQDAAPEDHSTHNHGNASGDRGWPEAVVEQVEGLPVQDGGRVKPFHTYAGFTLLRLHGSRRLTVSEDGEDKRLSPVEWMLDALLRPHFAAGDDLFLVQNGEVVEAMGLPLGADRGRTHYSLNTLQPGLGKLFELAREYSHIEDKNRSPVQQQVVLLAGNVDLYLGIQSEMSWARASFEVGPGERLAALMDGRTVVTLHEVVEKALGLQMLWQELEQATDATSADELHSVQGLLEGAYRRVERSMLAFLPPVASSEKEPEWMRPVDVFLLAMRGEPVADVHLQALAGWEAAAQHSNDAVVVAHELGGVSGGIFGLAEARGEGDSLSLELTYYKMDLLTWSLSLFVLAFLSCAFLWMAPRSKWLYRLGWVFSANAYLLLVAAITMRCIIRNRPPVSTLYETVLFVAATAGLSALVMEAINKRRIALSSAALFGMVMLFIANGYEVLDKRDTMPSLVAVLDTNFWLATHVTTITMGYAAGMLAALLGSIWVLGKTLRLKKNDPSFYKGLSRMVYGIICFAATLSIVGTILGGIWANDSWGRFWGWDPKENGALMIVIWQVAMLHARMAGWLRDKGFALAAAFGGTVIAFSWWGVNLLGVGLHSYGFTSGIHSALSTYYYIQWSIVGIGLLAVPGVVKAIKPGPAAS